MLIITTHTYNTIFLHHDIHTSYCNSKTCPYVSIKYIWLINMYETKFNTLKTTVYSFMFLFQIITSNTVNWEQVISPCSKNSQRAALCIQAIMFILNNLAIFSTNVIRGEHEHRPQQPYILQGKITYLGNMHGSV